MKTKGGKRRVLAALALVALALRAVIAPGYMLAVAQTPQGPLLAVTVCPSGLPDEALRLNWAGALASGAHAHAGHHAGDDHSGHTALGAGGHGAGGHGAHDHHAHDDRAHDHGAHAHGSPHGPPAASGVSVAAQSHETAPADHRDHAQHGGEHPCVFAVAAHAAPPAESPAPAVEAAPETPVFIPPQALRPGLGLPAPPPPATGPPVRLI